MAVMKQNNVVFVLDNGIYGVEQQGVNPNPFREKKETYEGYSDPIENPFNTKENELRSVQKELLQDFYAYNKISRWNYEKLGEVFDSDGFISGSVVKNIGELRAKIEEVKKDTSKSHIVRVMVPSENNPASQESLTQSTGEDEIIKKNWPPVISF